MAAAGQVSCPPAGSHLAVSGQFLVAAVTRWSAAGQVRDHALCLARLATAYATTGEQEQACTVTGELITIANGLGSARVAGQVADLRRSLSLWRYDSSVADLLHKLETFQAPMYAGSTGG
jgi:hypothetical protein